MLFDIQRFSVNDGPGIRTNFFFKGCPLRCIWCHNPESYMAKKQLSFLSNACVGCMACVDVCPNHVNRPVVVGGKKLLAVDYSACTACGKCLEVCCYDARSIMGREYTVDELKKLVETDRSYYEIPDERGEKGGITLTGGEPMEQFEFIDAFLEALDGSVHVCMETGGYAPKWKFEKLLGRVNLFLFDCKATDGEKHRELCGADNQVILENLRFLCENKADVILRLPLIPGVNDDEAHLKRVAELINENPNIRWGEIMAYHNMGDSKAEHIGLEELGSFKRYRGENAAEEQKKIWLETFHRYGLERIKIG